MPSCPTSSSGLVTFIGATTENPSFEVNSALLSRAAVYVLQGARRGRTGRAVRARAGRALCRSWSSTTRPGERLIGYADGDARRLLNVLETAADRGASRRRDQLIDAAFLEATLAQRPAPLRQGRRRLLRPDLGAAQIGARLQSGCRAVLAGAHARRRRRSALSGRGASCAWRSEDIGLADPRALRLALDAVRNLRAAGLARKANWRWRRR